MNETKHTVTGLPMEAPDDHHLSMFSEKNFRRGVTWFAIGGTCLLAGFFFLYLAHQTIMGSLAPKSWLADLLTKHYAAMVGVPLSAVTAFCIVSLLKVTNGPIEFEAPGFKFRGASGPIVLWILCFLAIALALFLW